MHEETGSQSLKRVLGRWDLTLLFVVAVFNLNVVPSIAANGGVTIWLWLVSLVLFFWPQGVAVIELSHRYPGEGGVYLWAKEVFGDFHGFLSGWCYWTTNMLYVPTVLLYFVGVSVYALGPSHYALADNKMFSMGASSLLLMVLVVLNIRGLGVGKWINNLGAIGSFIAAVVLMLLGVVVATRQGSTFASVDFRIPTDARFLANSFGVICFGLVGLELASVMGDEIQEPRRTMPGAVMRGGIISGALYVATTLVLLVAVGKNDISVLQGVVQAVAHMAGEVGIRWIVPPFALMLSVAIAGIGSAWLGGSARIPFVAGLDQHMPEWLGRIHPKYGTPYAGLIVQSSVSLILVLMNFAGAGVQEAFQTMLSLAVVLQLVPFVYMFAALIRLASRQASKDGVYSRTKLFVCGWCGLITTLAGISLAFFPSQTITSWKIYEAKMIAGVAFAFAVAWFLFFIYGRRRAQSVTAGNVIA